MKTIFKSKTNFLCCILFLINHTQVDHLMFPVEPTLIDITYEYLFQTERHPLRTLSRYSAPAKCHVLHKGLCAVATAVRQCVLGL